MKKNMSFRVVIQLVECYIWDVVVAGSNPVYPTINYLTVCTRTGQLDFSIIRDGNWLVSIKTGN